MRALAPYQIGPQPGHSSPGVLHDVGDRDAVEGISVEHAAQ